MSTQVSQTRYSIAQITIHWLTLILIIGAYFTHGTMHNLVRQARELGDLAQIEGPFPHVILGLGVLALTVVRVILRFVQGAPAHPEGQHPMITIAAAAGHGALYVLLFLLPMSGMAAWFGGIEAAGNAHEVIFVLMLILVAGHALAALFHQFVIKDNLLARMRPRG